MSNSTRAAIYVRVSSDQQEDNYSLGTQRAKCEAYCAAANYLVPDGFVFQDIQSGAELWERRGLTTLRELVRSGQIQVVVAYKVDRLTRSQLRLGMLLTEAEHHNVRLEFVKERLDDTPQGQFLRNAFGFVADMERENFRERSLRGKEARVRSGKPLHGRRPLYGYRWNDDKSAYLIYEPEAEVVRRTFEDMAAGKTLGAITRALIEEGIQPPCGNTTGSRIWRLSGIGNLLKQPAYWGEAKAYRFRVVRVKEVHPFTGEVKVHKVYYKRPIEEQISVADAIPALVTRDVADEVQRRLAHNKATSARNTGQVLVALLRKGFAKCGYCGHNMVVFPRSAKHGGPV